MSATGAAVLLPWSGSIRRLPRLPVRTRDAQAGPAVRLAIIGAGNLGTALGKRLAASGHEIVYAEGESAHRAATSHRSAHAASTADAVRDADVGILAVPYSALAQTLSN